MNRPTVLIVEDEADLRLLLEFLFNARGYEVLTARTGLEALHLGRTRRPDAALLDISLPDIDGFGVLAELRTLAPDCRVIVVTANSDDRVEAQARKLGACDYIAKPFSPSVLEQAVRSQLQI